MTVPLPDVATKVRDDYAAVHGWRVDHTIHTRGRSGLASCLVEHQLTFTAGPDSIVCFWNATRDGVDVGYPDFMLYHDLDLVQRSNQLADLIGWFALKATA